MRFGRRVTAVRDDGDGVLVEAQDVQTGEVTWIGVRYLIGCDGPRSLVRQTMGTAYSGGGGAKREFSRADVGDLGFHGLLKLGESLGCVGITGV